MTRERSKRQPPAQAGAADPLNVWEALGDELTPQGRIEALGKWPQLAERVAKLKQRLTRSGGVMDDRTWADLVTAEAHASCLEAAPVLETGHAVRKPFAAANAERTVAAEEQQQEWQARAAAKWAEPQHKDKSATEIARLIAKDGENPNTIRRRIKKPS